MKTAEAGLLTLEDAGPEDSTDPRLSPVSYRVGVRPALLFSAMRASDPALWDMLLEPGQGHSSNTVSVVCQRKVALTAKRSVNTPRLVWSQVTGHRWDLDRIHQHF